MRDVWYRVVVTVDLPIKEVILTTSGSVPTLDWCTMYPAELQQPRALSSKKPLHTFNVLV